MNPNPRYDRDRLDELLSERAVFGLSPTDTAELDQLLSLAGDEVDPFDLERLATICELSSIGSGQSGKESAMPADVAQRILAAAKTIPPIPSSETPPTPHVCRCPIWATFAAVSFLAACCLFCVPFFSRPLERSDRLSVAELREQVVAHPDTIHLDWTATEDPAAKGVGGDIVWNHRLQTGFMRFHGLATNNPEKSQYQLWIFDKQRDDRYPVDGGVFNVSATSEDVIVPISAKLPVDQAVLFAVTIEAPGGVVVSDRSRLPLLAKVDTP